MNRPTLLALATASLVLAACNPDPGPLQYGANPELPDPKRGLLPQMVIADPGEWGDRVPVVPEGFEVRAIATGLGIPRQTLVLPNGDILVAEGRGGNAPALKPKDVIAGPIKAAGTTSVQSGNRLTLLRDADGDGDYETQTVFGLHPTRHAHVVRMQVAHDQSRDRGVAQADTLEAGVEGLMSWFPIAPAVDQDDAVIRLEGVAVHP